MAVRQVTQWLANPGRLPDVFAHMAEAKQIHERLGWRVRAFQTQVGGPQPISLAYVTEADTMADHLAILEKSQADAQWQSFVQRVLGSPTPAATPTFSGLSREIAGLEAGVPTSAPGSLVLVVRQLQAKPGRQADLIQQCRDLQPIVASLGGSLSAAQNTFAGPATGIISTVNRFEGLAAFGAFTQKADASTELQAFVARTQAPDAPGIPLSAVFATELPI